MDGFQASHHTYNRAFMFIRKAKKYRPLHMASHSYEVASKQIQWYQQSCCFFSGSRGLALLACYSKSRNCLVAARNKCWPPKEEGEWKGRGQICRGQLVRSKLAIHNNSLHYILSSYAILIQVL